MCNFHKNKLLWCAGNITWHLLLALLCGREINDSDYVVERSCKHEVINKDHKTQNKLIKVNEDHDMKVH